jgi:hypothetical protein
MKISRAALWIAVFGAISASAVIGCQYFPESTFELASESRLPRFVTLPAGLTRADVSLEMSYYVKPWGRSATFTLRNGGRILVKVNGKQKGSEPLQLSNPPTGFDHGYPSYEIITANGITEIVEHRKMEPIFYVTDDPAVRNELLAGPENK